jgi:hypothetical protein
MHVHAPVAMSLRIPLLRPSPCHSSLVFWNEGRCSGRHMRRRIHAC